MSTRRPPFQARVEQILDLTSSVRDLRLNLLDSKDFSFRCGQFVMLHIPGDPKPVLRAYSVASSDQDPGALRLIFKFVPGGKASEFIWKLHQGEILNLTGPFGRVFFVEPPPDQVVFVSTSTGLAPHLSYLLSKKTALQKSKVVLYFGVRSESDIFCEKDLLAIQKDWPQFQYHVVLSRPDLHWTGRKGYVQDFLHETHYQKHRTDFYLCGNGQMIKETQELLERNGIGPDQIHSEAFY